MVKGGALARELPRRQREAERARQRDLRRDRRSDHRRRLHHQELRRAAEQEADADAADRRDADGDLVVAEAHFGRGDARWGVNRRAQRPGEGEREGDKSGAEHGFGLTGDSIRMQEGRDPEDLLEITREKKQRDCSRR